MTSGWGRASGTFPSVPDVGGPGYWLCAKAGPYDGHLA
jgi:hypothetical protein